MKRIVVNAPRPSLEYFYGQKAATDMIPWMLPKAFSYLKLLARSYWKIYEWGSGGSTIWFSENCDSVVSLETNSLWLKNVSVELRNRDLHKKCMMTYITDRRSYYTDILNEPQNGTFNMIYIDSTYGSKAICIRNAIKKLKYFGILMVNNAHVLPSGLFTGFNEVRFITLPFSIKEGGRKMIWSTSFFRKLYGLPK